MNDLDGSLKKSDLNYRIIGIYEQIKPHALKVQRSMTEKQSMSRHYRNCAFHKFTDISEVLQPLPSAKLA